MPNTIAATVLTPAQTTNSKTKTEPAQNFAFLLTTGDTTPKSPEPPAETAPTPSFAGPPTDIFGRKWGSGAISIDEINAYGQELADKATADLNTLFAQYNIAKHPPVDMRFTREGEFVIGNHPDKAKIEKALADHPEVKDAIGHALGMQSFGAELRQYEVYMQRYTQAWEKGGQNALNALTERYLGLTKPQFSYSYSLSGLTLLANEGSVQDWLEATDRALS